MARIERAETLGVAFQHGSPQVDLLRTVAHARYVAAHQSRGVRDRLEGTAARVIHGQGRVSSAPARAASHRRRRARVALRPAAGGDRRGPWEPPFAQVDHDRIFTTARRARPARAAASTCSWSAPAPRAASTPSSSAPAASRVTLLSARPQILPDEDRDIAEIVAGGLPRARHASCSSTRACPTSSARTRASRRRPKTAAPSTAATPSSAWACARTPAAWASTDRRRARRARRHRRRRPPAHDGRERLRRRRRRRRHDARLHRRDAGPPRRAPRRSARERAARPATVAVDDLHAPRVRVASASRRGGAGTGARVAVTKHYLGANPRGVISGQREGMIKLVAGPPERRAPRRLDRRLPRHRVSRRWRSRSRRADGRHARRQRHGHALDVRVAAARRREGRHRPHDAGREVPLDARDAQQAAGGWRARRARDRVTRSSMNSSSARCAPASPAANSAAISCTRSESVRTRRTCGREARRSGGPPRDRVIWTRPRCPPAWARSRGRAPRPPRS